MGDNGGGIGDNRYSDLTSQAQHLSDWLAGADFGVGHLNAGQSCSMGQLVPQLLEINASEQVYPNCHDFRTGQVVDRIYNRHGLDRPDQNPRAHRRSQPIDPTDRDPDGIGGRPGEKYVGRIAPEAGCDARTGRFEEQAGLSTSVVHASRVGVGAGGSGLPCLDHGGGKWRPSNGIEVDGFYVGCTLRIGHPLTVAIARKCRTRDRGDCCDLIDAISS